MSVLQAFLVAMLYFLNTTPWPFGGMGNYATIYRPLVNGFLVGLILGDPVKGTIVGATINLMYLGFISAGGAMPSDMALAGILGTALAITGNMDPNTAVAVAVPLGLIGAIGWVASMTICTVFVHLAEKFANEGKPERVWIANVLLPQVIRFVLYFIPCFLAAYFGSAYIQNILDILGGRVLQILSIIGGMLPAVGIGMLLRFIFKGEARVFFFLGFLIAVYFKIDIVALSFISLCVAVIYMQLKGQLKGKEGEVGNV